VCVRGCVTVMQNFVKFNHLLTKLFNFNRRKLAFETYGLNTSLAWWIKQLIVEKSLEKCTMAEAGHLTVTVMMLAWHLLVSISTSCIYVFLYVEEDLVVCFRPKCTNIAERKLQLVVNKLNGQMVMVLDRDRVETFFYREIFAKTQVWRHEKSRDI